MYEIIYSVGAVTKALLLKAGPVISDQVYALSFTSKSIYIIHMYLLYNIYCMYCILLSRGNQIANEASCVLHTEHMKYSEKTALVDLYSDSRGPTMKVITAFIQINRSFRKQFVFTYSSDY